MTSGQAGNTSTPRSFRCRLQRPSSPASRDAHLRWKRDRQRCAGSKDGRGSKGRTGESGNKENIGSLVADSEWHYWGQTNGHGLCGRIAELRRLGKHYNEKAARQVGRRIGSRAVKILCVWGRGAEDLSALRTIRSYQTRVGVGE